MNIFLLDEDPTLAAAYHCDKHVVKMVLETAQILSTAFIASEPPDVTRTHVAPYRPTHARHPCVLWAAANRDNAKYLSRIGLALAAEYTYRYGRTHASTPLLTRLAAHYEDAESFTDFSNFPQCMPTEYQVLGRPVKAYRNYYLSPLKAHLLSYGRRRLAPAWLAPVVKAI